MSGERPSARLETPALVLAADHRARAVVTVEHYGDYLAAQSSALPHCDGVPASAQPLRDLRRERAGGGAGTAIGRSLYQDSTPGEAARMLADVVHGTSPCGPGVP